MTTKKMVTLAVTVTLAMALSFLESQIPAFVAVPGIKIGLANIAVIFTLYRFDPKCAAAVSVLRVLLVSLLFGSTVSLIYSVSGAVLSFLVMIVARRVRAFSTVGVSVLGGVFHNVGQIGAACVLLGTDALLYYLPVLVISGTVAGVVVGLCASLLIRRVPV